MTLLLVLGSLLTLLAATCLWESRSGKPAWGSHLRGGQPPTPADAARTGKKAVGASVAVGLFMGIGGDG